MDLSLKIAIFAMVAQVFLTLYIFMRMGKARTSALIKGDLHIRDIALSNDAWTDDIKKLGNNLQNQFETPILFYTAVMLAVALSFTSWVIAIASVIYVCLRVVHHRIHIGKNHVPSRFKVFVLSLVTLVVMWVAIVVEVIML